MNVKRFSARTSRDALHLVRQAFGDEAVVLSTRPCPEGVEVLAMAPDGLQQIEKFAAQVPAAAAASAAAQDTPAATPATHVAARAPARGAGAAAPRIEPSLEPASVDRDVEQLAMSTLSFQDYVRERMLMRRHSELSRAAANAAAGSAAGALPASAEASPPATRAGALPHAADDGFAARAAKPTAAARARALAAPPLLHDELAMPAAVLAPSPRAHTEAHEAQQRDTAMISELRAMKGLIEERFGTLAFMEKLQRSPRQAQLAQRLLDAGFSPALIRKLSAAIPDDVADELAWAAGVLERNLAAAEQEPPLEEAGGVYALIGSTGVGKTTSTAKIAAAFAARHGATQLGLVTLDAYRVGAHEQLRAYGRILGVPVHTAHDRASLEDLLELLAGKRMVLIDTAGIGQRDARTRELLEMLSHRSIQKLLVLNAAAQGETVEDVLLAYRAASCRGAVISKMDEAVKLAPLLDGLIRHKLRVVGVANGQRVPEDWHRLSAQALVQRALRATPGPSWRLDAGEVNLVFATPPSPGRAALIGA